jgi:DNA-directed RNA polymerase subunit RPC12/RpoP
MRWLLKFIKNVALFFAYYALVSQLLWENTKEWLCMRCSLNQDHKWVQTSNIERGNTRTYNRCRRCGAVR